MKQIQLGGGKYALVDDEDFEFLSQFSWHYANGYAVSTIRMHRLVSKTDKQAVCDHKNMNRLDNQRANLRNCTNSQNQYNKGPNGNRIYKGISQNGPARFSVETRYKKKRLNCGSFKTAHTAALAYDFWATYLHGEFAQTNFTVISSSEKPLGGSYGQVRSAEKHSPTYRADSIRSGNINVQETKQ